MEYIRDKGEVMATKNDLVRTLARTEELAHELGWVQQDESLVFFAPTSSVDHWSVRVRITDPDKEGVSDMSGTLLWLPDSGRSIGRTKPAAQETLRTVNGVLATIVAEKRRERR